MAYVLVTGASSGIGQDVAISLSNEYDIILNGRDLSRLEDTQHKCSTQHNVVIWQYDLSDIANLEADLTSFILDNGLNVEKFVHCAGYCKNLPLKMIDLNLLITTFNVNVFAGILISKVLSLFRVNKRNLNNIVFISSNISGFGAKAHTVYGASKMAVDGMMKSLAVEMAPRIRVNTVLPGAVKTMMTEHIYADKELINRMAVSYPLGLGNTHDIYNAVSFLLSDKARWITGQQIIVDGGRTSNITG